MPTIINSLSVLNIKYLAIVSIAFTLNPELFNLNS